MIMTDIVTIHVLSKSGVWGFEIRAFFLQDGLPAKAYELHLHKAIWFYGARHLPVHIVL